MRVYIASSFSLQERIDRVLSQLKIMEIFYTVDWWNRKTLKEKYAPFYREAFYMNPDCAYAYETDIRGVKDADLLLFIADEVPRKYNGGAVEIGLAIAYNKPILCWGRLENSAMFYTVKQVDSLSEFVLILQMYKERLIKKESMRNE